MRKHNTTLSAAADEDPRKNRGMSIHARNDNDSNGFSADIHPRLRAAEFANPCPAD
jgi:hypothetical protein